jgi:Mg2+-importing ATPase
MLPMQILLTNFLYDLAQITIPSDNVDASFMQKPRRWSMTLIRRFMLAVGPVSSVYDFLTFFVLLRVLHASEALFHTGWFVESLATQTLVIFVIRTASSPLRSHTSRALTLTTLGIVALGVLLPYSPAARVLGLVPLPLAFFAFLVVATATYLAMVNGVKFWLFRRAFA